MTVGILIISHDEIGRSLLETAGNVIGACPLRTLNMSVSRDCEPERMVSLAKGHIHDLDSGDGVLVLTDMYGSTPSNIACALMEHDNVAVVSGVNLPMILRLLNYPGLTLDELVDKAVSGGKEGIMDCRPHQ